jgi:hypothetical protein
VFDVFQHLLLLPDQTIQIWCLFAHLLKAFCLLSGQAMCRPVGRFRQKLHENFACKQLIREDQFV